VCASGVYGEDREAKMKCISLCFPSGARDQKSPPHLFILKANTYSGSARPRRCAKEDRFRHERKTEVRQVNTRELLFLLPTGRSWWIRNGHFETQVVVKKACLPRKPDSSGPLEDSYLSIHPFTLPIVDHL